MPPPAAASAMPPPDVRATAEGAPGDRWHRAAGRTHQDFPPTPTTDGGGDAWYFVAVADPQLGMIDANAGTAAEEALLARLVPALGRLSPPPRFVALLGDLVHAHVDLHGGAIPADLPDVQVAALKGALAPLPDRLPLVLVPGNHDVGNTPTPASISAYARRFGDDYYAFAEGDVRVVVLNSGLLADAAAAPAAAAAMDGWLANLLATDGDGAAPPSQTLVLAHHPWFLRTATEADDPGTVSRWQGVVLSDAYFHLPTAVRLPSLAVLEAAGVTGLFGGHWHQNGGGVAELPPPSKGDAPSAGGRRPPRRAPLEQIITSSVGGQLGTDVPGVRLVKVAGGRLAHRYFGVDELPVTVPLNADRLDEWA